jgi:hypothetical protein
MLPRPGTAYFFLFDWNLDQIKLSRLDIVAARGAARN